MTYQLLNSKSSVLVGTGNVVIVTGWTPKEAIAKHFQTKEYAAIGQLYSPTRGINYLVRNLLFNPHVNHLVILGATKEDIISGSTNCLLDFFKNGFHLGESELGQSCWVIDSVDRGYIDLEVSESALNDLRQRISCQSAKSLGTLVQKIKEINKQEMVINQSLDKSIFPTRESPVTQYPGPLYGHRIEGKTIAQTWVKIIHRIKTTGIVSDTQHDGQWQELIDVMAIITDEPLDFYFPNPNYLPVDRAFIDSYIPQILGSGDKRNYVGYTYGDRLRSWFGRDQIEGAIEVLNSYPNSARAVMSLWDATTGETNINPPCLNHVWLRIFDSKLSLTATFRSNDMFSAWIANAMGLRALQTYCFSKLINKNVNLGPLIIISESAHIYEDCWERCDRLIENQYPIKSGFNDKSGSFIIALESSEIIANWITSGNGEVVKTFKGKTAKQVCKTIANSVPGLELEHALYLGTELAKAEIALKSGSSYTQDAITS